MPRSRSESRTSARGRVDVGGKKDPIFKWGFKSASMEVAGQAIPYTTLLYSDGSTSCNCMGWIIEKKDRATGKPKPRECKHTKRVGDEAKEIHKKWKKGEQLPVIGQEGDAQDALVIAAMNQNNKAGDSRIEFGRVLDLD